MRVIDCEVQPQRYAIQNHQFLLGYIDSIGVVAWTQHAHAALTFDQSEAEAVADSLRWRYGRNVQVVAVSQERMLEVG